MEKTKGKGGGDGKKPAPTVEKKQTLHTQLKKAREAAAEAVSIHNQKLIRHQKLKTRVEVVRQGATAYRAHHASDAVLSFKTYLRLLEEDRNVTSGGLNPTQFDKTKDLPELLLISGVYWDLMKLYDQTRSKEKSKEFLQYVEKFLLFAKDMPFQKLCTESLRKYIKSGRPRHKEEFKNAYKLLGGGDCFVATALVDVCEAETLPRLRTYRDEKLAKNLYGRAFIRGYYRYGPHLAQVTDRLPKALRLGLGKSLDRLSRLL